jgi:integrase
MLAMTPRWLWVAADGKRGTLTVQATRVPLRGGGSMVWEPKDKEKRSIPLHPRVLEFLESYGMREPFMLAPHKGLWPRPEKSSYRFDPRKGLKALGVRSGAGEVTYHQMRRTFGTMLAMKGVPIRTIAEYLGDGIQVTEEHYIGFAPKEGNPLDVL